VAYAVRLKPSAAEAVRKLPKTQQRRVTTKIASLAQEPHPPGCRKLQGSDRLYRIRVGDYRIVYAVEDQELIVLIVRIGRKR
jgi:mRNA interferase RelE/StbE